MGTAPGDRSGKAAGLSGFRFHDLRHTVVTDLLEAGEPDHVIQAVTGQLSKKMLEHYSHQRLKAKGQMLTRMEERQEEEGKRLKPPTTLTSFDGAFSAGWPGMLCGKHLVGR